MTKKPGIPDLRLAASALLMLAALLWLTVSTPFVYASQQAAIEAGKAPAEKNTGNPLSDTNEEKVEIGVNTLSEYLHETVSPSSAPQVLVTYEKCHASGLYHAFHPELHAPPPNGLG